MSDERAELSARPDRMTAIDELIAEYSHSSGRGFMPRVGDEFGGVEARILLVLRDPGPRVATTRVLSLENPDPTARRQKAALGDAGVRARLVLAWNAYPWYREEQSGAPSVAELDEAVPVQLALLERLPLLKVVLLQGHSAAAGWTRITLERPDLERERDLHVLRTFHPSARGMAVDPRRHAHLVAAWRRALEVASR